MIGEVWQKESCYTLMSFYFIETVPVHWKHSDVLVVDEFYVHMQPNGNTRQLCNKKVAEVFARCPCYPGTRVAFFVTQRYVRVPRFYAATFFMAVFFPKSGTCASAAQPRMNHVVAMETLI